MRTRIVMSALAAAIVVGISSYAFAQDALVCGTETASVDSEIQKTFAASASAVQASELLLFIDFNSNGTVVVPGFGNAETHRSTLVNSVRFCPSPGLSQAQQDEIVRQVSDEFSPFRIRVTTDLNEFLAYPAQNREMCLITTFPAVIGQPSSVAGVSPFILPGVRLANNFAFAFSSTVSNVPGDVAEIVSHESAHLLGLQHQHLFNPSCGFITEYHPGFGSGPLSFDPIMGSGFTEGINNWFAQSCPDPFFGLPQDDLALIASQVVFRDDDFPDTPDGAVTTLRQIDGILERPGDVDHIRINFRGPGAVTVTSDNIDLKVSVLNPGGKVMDEFNDPDSPNVTVPRVNGMRYLRIEAADNQNMSAQFMTGRYTISY